MKKPQDHILVIFGASGDLTYRKLVPALFDLFKQNLLPEKFAVLGVSRSDFSNDKFRDKMKDGISKFANFKNEDAEFIDEFLKMLCYLSIDTENTNEYEKLKTRLKQIEDELGTGGNVIYYLSTPPNLYGIIPTGVRQSRFE